MGTLSESLERLSLLLYQRMTSEQQDKVAEISKKMVSDGKASGVPFTLFACAQLMAATAAVQTLEQLVGANQKKKV